MIRIYIQYSYGGFKTLFAEGHANELLDKEVTSDNAYDFPDDAHCHFQYSGCKMAYRELSNGEFDLIVREIPSIHKDGDGRSIPCAVQFIGGPSDRHTLDYMAADIANDINSFHDFFSELFWVRNGLVLDGDKLRTWIESHNTRIVCDGPVKQINNIATIKSGMILFVALSDKFGNDTIATQNVTEELRLPFKQMKKDDCFIAYSTLKNYQRKSSFSPLSIDNNEISEDVIDNVSDVNKDRNSKEKKEDCFEQFTKNLKDIDFDKIKDDLSRNKKLYIIILILLLYSLYSLIFK